MTRSIEEYFPIVEINKLAVPERNAFKPIYQMHKWFARRSSSVFRAILLGAMKPAGTDIMEEFYKDHTNDPDTNGKVILDPFMGGGTTIVEALRLGCKVIGIDLNPVAWFIVKTEVEPVDIDELKQAFERLSERKVEWSGNPLKETLLDLYKTECPGCRSKDADIIYTFWVKSAPCTTALCSSFTPLFPDYIVAAKSPSIRYYPDVECPECKNKFDWEKEPASLIADKKLMVNAGKFSAGDGRTNTRWAYSDNESKSVNCPWCEKKVNPLPQKAKLSRKKVNLTVLNCPECEEVWQFRGPLPDEVNCPTCKHSCDPKEGNIPAKGKFICHGTCGGNVDNIINSIRKHPANELLPVKAYALEGYCEHCARKPGAKGKKNKKMQNTFFDDTDETEEYLKVADKSLSSVESVIWKNNGKFFKRVSPKDTAKYKHASETWSKEKKNLPYPKSEVPVGEKTKSGLIAHHYKYWNQMFNDRQLLGLSTLLKAIDEEEDQVMKELVLSGFFNTLETSNMFTVYHSTRFLSAGVFARHDFQPKVTICENNVWGSYYGNKTFKNAFQNVVRGKEFAKCFKDLKFDEKKYYEFISPDSLINKDIDNSLTLVSKSSADLNQFKNSSIDYVITDPPYAGNVNYSELADFFYVWLRLILNKTYEQFTPEFCPKVEEVIQNRTRGKSLEDFQDGMIKIFSEMKRVLSDQGLLIFTFHHAGDKVWEKLLEAILLSGFYLESVYPIHGDDLKESGFGAQSISFDLIHVCKKISITEKNNRSWSNVRNEIRKKARNEIAEIENRKNINLVLNPADINIILIGKCLELYSKHYGMIVDHAGKPVPLGDALEQIKMLVDQLITKDDPIPSELENIDIASYVYLTSLLANKEIKSDDVHKNTKGLIETSKLREYGLIVKGREKRGRTFEVKQPLDRLNDLKTKFRENGSYDQEGLFGDDGRKDTGNFLFIDYMHLLLGVAESGENLIPWLDKFRGKRPMIRAACQYMKSRGQFVSQSNKILNLIESEEKSLFPTTNKN